jgi:hypothetical protein
MPGPLAQKIRAKFPGVYDDMDDATLEKAVLAKHPEYADLAEPEPAKPRGGMAGYNFINDMLSNAPASAGKFATDTLKGVVGMGKGAMSVARGEVSPEQALAIAKQLPGAIWGSMVERYGSAEQALNTIKTDPVGVLGDVSTVAGVGAATRAPKIAGMLGKVERATNPLNAVAIPASKLADKASSAVIKGTLRPSAAIRDDFGGSQGVADAVKANRVYSEASAQRKLSASTAKADQMLADAQAAGTPGVRRGAVAASLRGEPREKATRRTRLGNTDERPALQETARNITKNNPREIPLTDAQALKREAQELAYEAAKDNKSVTRSAEKAKARALRTGIEDRVPEVGPVNEQSQGLLGATKAFADAQDRPQALTNMLALGTAGTVGAGTGDITSALVSAALMKGLNSPRAGAMTGIAINELGKAAINPDLLRAALIARLTGQQEP